MDDNQGNQNRDTFIVKFKHSFLFGSIMAIGHLVNNVEQVNRNKNKMRGSKRKHVTVCRMDGSQGHLCRCKLSVVSIGFLLNKEL